MLRSGVLPVATASATLRLGPLQSATIAVPPALFGSSCYLTPGPLRSSIRAWYGVAEQWVAHPERMQRIEDLRRLDSMATAQGSPATTTFPGVPFSHAGALVCSPMRHRRLVEAGGRGIGTTVHARRPGVVVG